VAGWKWLEGAAGELRRYERRLRERVGGLLAMAVDG